MKLMGMEQAWMRSSRNAAGCFSRASRTRLLWQSLMVRCFKPYARPPQLCNLIIERTGQVWSLGSGVGSTLLVGSSA